VTATEGKVRETHFVQWLQRGLDVIRAFDAAHPSMTLSETARATGLARAAARRFLLTLVDLGYVRVEDRRFRLTPRVLELGRVYLSGLSLPEIAQPHMRAFVEEVRESSSLSVLDDDHVVYGGRVQAKRIMSGSISLGTRFPAYATSMGRVLLAAEPAERLAAYLATAELRPLTERTARSREKLEKEIDRVRTQGWAMVDQELEEGVRSVAVPVHDASGRVAAALNVSGHASRWTLEDLEQQLLPKLLETAANVDRDVRASGTG